MSLNQARRVVSDIMRAAGLEGMQPAMTWKAWEEQWWERQRGTVAASSEKAYGAILKRWRSWLVERGGSTGVSVLLSNLSEREAQAFCDWLLREELSWNSRKQALVLLRSIFELAREAGHLQRNVWALVKLKGEAVKGEREVFTAAEISAILSRADVTWQLMTLLGLCTGLRLSDCARLTWESIRVVGSSMVLVVMPAKTKRKKRTLELPVVEPLLGVLQAVPKERRSGLLLPGLAEYSATHLSRLFVAVCDQAGVKSGQMASSRKMARRTKSFHSLRHTLNTWMDSAGVSQERRMRITGHSTTKSNDVYTHTEVGLLREALVKALVGKVD